MRVFFSRFCFSRERFFALVLTLIILCNPVVAFAEDVQAGLFPSSWIENGKNTIGLLLIKDEPQDRIDFFLSLLGNNPNVLVMAGGFTNSAGMPAVSATFNYFSFLLLPPSATYTVAQNNIGGYDFAISGNGSQITTITFSLTQESMLLPVNKRSYSVSDFGVWSTSFTLFDNVMHPSHKQNQFRYIVGGGFIGSATTPIVPSKYLKLPPNGDDLQIWYDIPPEEPDPPSSSSTPEPSPPPTIEQPPLNFPTFPKVENKWVPYDTTIWNDFAHKIRSSIGNSTNIGFTIFAIILGILVALRVVKRFTGSHGGNN